MARASSKPAPAGGGAADHAPFAGLAVLLWVIAVLGFLGCTWPCSTPTGW